MVALNEDWAGLGIGDDVTDSADWSYQGGTSGTAVVSAVGFDTDIRSAAWAGTTTSGGFMTTWTNQAVVYTSWYWKYVLDAGSGTVYIAKISPNAGGAGAEFRISGGNFQIRNNFAAVDTSGLSVSSDTWYRFDWVVSNTGTTQTLNIYTGANLHGTTADEALTGTYNQGTVGRLIFGSVANADGTDVSSKYAYIGIADSAFAAPYAGGGKLDTPANFTFARVDGVRQINAACSAVSGAVSYDLQVQYLSGADPEVEADWTALNTFNAASPSWTLTSANGLVWEESYRGRVVAKVT